MSESFDGYHVWLGIPPGEQPPNHYRLLGIAAFETDLDVIDHAADRQMAHVRTFQAGRHGQLSQQILNELAAARVCLLNAQRKAEYDEQLRARLATKVAPVPVGRALPVAQAVAAAVPRAAPVSKPLVDDEFDVEPVDAPLATRLADDDSEILPERSPFSAPAIEIRAPRRPIDRDAPLERALYYILIGVVVVVVLMVLGGLVPKWIGSDWKQLFSTPEYSAPEEPAGDASSAEAPAAPTPQAPAPAPPIASPAEDS
jgi:hypothetical protein